MSEIETNTIDPSAASPGAILKRCREYHDMSLEEAEEATKIGANYLQALEEDQVSQFASLAYLKGFLRIYATYLGLNPDDMIRLVRKAVCRRQRREGRPEEHRRGNYRTPPRKKFPLQKLVMPAVILVLILITAAIINRSPAPPLRQNQPAPAASQRQRRSHSSHIPLPGRARRPARPDETAVEQKRGDAPPPHSGAQKSPAENPRGFVVRLKVTQSGTLTVTIDGSTSQAYDLVVGDSIEWKADRTITLELSNAGGVEAELNGRQLKPFGQPGKPATVVLDSEGIRQ